jgi:phosphate transport system substrate-binding protein
MRRSRTDRWMHAALAIAVASGSVVMGTSPAAASGPQVKGAGSTFAQIAIEQWARDSASRLGVNVIYSGTGSTSGRSQFAGNVVDWASSDVNFPRSEQPVPRAFTYLPLVAGGTSFIYQLRDAGGARITNLQLSPTTVSKIFLGQIKSWRDPLILADNPHLTNVIPDIEVRPVLRAEGSGTTSVLMGFFSQVDPPAWHQFLQEFPEAEVEQTDVVSSFIQRFPDRAYGDKVTGSFGVVTRIAENTPAANGRIGYAEYAYAKQAQGSLAVARVKNRAGKWTLPEARAVAIALTGAQRNPDGTQNLTGVFSNGNPETYPVSSYNYAIVPTQDFPADKGDTLTKFLVYSVTEGQAKAERLGYSPLPCNLIEQSLRVSRGIPGAARDIPTKCGIHGSYYQKLKPAAPYTPPPPVAGGGGTGGSGTGGATGGTDGGTGGTDGSSATGGTTDGALEGVDGVLFDAAEAAEVRSDRLAELKDALEDGAGPGDPPSSWPLVLAGAVVVMVVFAPATLGRILTRWRASRTPP